MIKKPDARARTTCVGKNEMDVGISVGMLKRNCAGAVLQSNAATGLQASTVCAKVESNVPYWS
jgi:hypothetical protein